MFNVVKIDENMNRFIIETYQSCKDAKARIETELSHFEFSDFDGEQGIWWGSNTRSNGEIRFLIETKKE